MSDLEPYDRMRDAEMHSEARMSTVTLYEYVGETRHERGVSANWEQVGNPVEFDPHEMHWQEALLEVFATIDLPGGWDTNYRVNKRTMAYEAHSDHRPVYRAEVSSK